MGEHVSMTLILIWKQDVDLKLLNSVFIWLLFNGFCYDSNDILKLIS